VVELVPFMSFGKRSRETAPGAVVGALPNAPFFCRILTPSARPPKGMTWSLDAQLEAGAGRQTWSVREALILSLSSTPDAYLLQCPLASRRISATRPSPLRRTGLPRCSRRLPPAPSESCRPLVSLLPTLTHRHMLRQPDSRGLRGLRAARRTWLRRRRTWL
jgi:hypothetical protein